MSLSEFLANPVIPLNLSITLLVLAAILFILRWRKTAAFLTVGALAWVVFWSLPTSSLWAGGLLEQRYPSEPPASLPTAQAIVVLGGNTANGRQNWFESFDRKTATLRTDTAAKLYAAGRAPLIVVSGAALDGGMSEARMMTQALEHDGIPTGAILQEDHSLTTHQNAVYTARLLRQHDIRTFLLVTSPRAAAIADAGHFHGKLAESGMPFGALIVNRVREPVAADASDVALAAELTGALGEKLARKVLHDLDDHNRLAERDARNLERMRTELDGGELLAVPELSGDVHDLGGLAAVAAQLFNARRG